MAMKSLSKLDEEILVCSICLDTLKDPKILGCLHRYCKECLANVIENGPNGETFHCPTCRQEFEIPNGRIEGIKGDFLLQAVLENRKLERDLKEKQREQICSSCDKHSTMVAICPDCGGLVCGVCHLGHQIMKTFRSHNHVVTLEDIESGEVTFNVQNITSTSKAPKCQVHKDMILHINCKTCEKLICPVCAPIHHNNHELEEVTSASKRIKGRVQELVEKSTMSEKELEESLEELRKTRQVKLGEITVISAQLKETADGEEQIIRQSEQEFMEWLERKKKLVQEETNESVRNLRQEEAFLAKEIKLMEEFCIQTSQNMEEQVQAEMKKISNSKMTARFLMNDVDNWAVLFSSSDIENNLQVRGNTVKEVKLATKSLTEFAAEFHGLRTSVMGSNLCWKIDWSIELSKIDGNWTQPGFAKSICDLKFISEVKGLVVATLINRGVNLAIIDNNLQATTTLCGYLWKNIPPPKYVRVAGTLSKSIYSTAKWDGLLHSCLTHEKGDGSYSSPCFNVNAEDAVVSCVAQFKNETKLIVGLCGSTVLHKCDFAAKGLSSIAVNFKGLRPPVSLATTNEDIVLLCDGVSSAIAVNIEGNVNGIFGGRNLKDRPVVISGDRNGFVYVLWKINDEQKSGMSYMEETGMNNKEKTENAANNDTKHVISVVRQYTPSGTFISEFMVDSNVTLMTTIVAEDGEDAVAVGTPEGLIQCYSMTSLGKTWSSFLQQQSIE